MAVTIQVTPLNGSPGVIDEVTIHDGAADGPSVHIERMDKHSYWVRIGEHEFTFRTAARRGSGIELRKLGG